MKRIIKLQKEPDKVFKSEDGSTVTLPGQNLPETAFNKINELVCAVNEIQRELETINCAMLDLATPSGENKALKALDNQTKQPTETYAEQHRWIGRLCRFWDDGCDVTEISVLKLIDETDDTPFLNIDGTCWQHCEPIKPNDPLIYRGE